MPLSFHQRLGDFDCRVLVHRQRLLVRVFMRPAFRNVGMLHPQESPLGLALERHAVRLRFPTLVLNPNAHPCQHPKQQGHSHYASNEHPVVERTEHGAGRLRRSRQERGHDRRGLRGRIVGGSRVNLDCAALVD